MDFGVGLTEEQRSSAAPTYIQVKQDVRKRVGPSTDRRSRVFMPKRSMIVSDEVGCQKLCPLSYNVGSTVSETLGWSLETPQMKIVFSSRTKEAPMVPKNRGSNPNGCLQLFFSNLHWGSDQWDLPESIDTGFLLKRPCDTATMTKERKDER